MKERRIPTAACAVLLCTLLLFSCAPHYERAEGYAMGTFVSVTSRDGQSALSLLPAVSTLENEISHSIDSSLIAALNRGETVTLSKEVYAALSLSLELSEATGGAFSVLVLPITSLWDFDRGVRPTDAALAEALKRMEDSELLLEDGRATLKSGGVDLGAIGKGLAADILASALADAGEEGLVAVGGSIGAVGKKNGEPWRIGVRDPFSSSQSATLGTLSLSDAFVSTSGSYEKSFEENGEQYHHILDPKTGMPVAKGLVSVTVIAESGVLSDALSTALFAVGMEEGRELCARYGAEALFVTSTGEMYATDGFLSVFTSKSGEVHPLAA